VALRTGPYDEVRDRLLRLPGIGRPLVGVLMIRGLGQTERVSPVRELSRAAEHVYRRPIGEPEFQRLADHYGAWQGYWATTSAPPPRRHVTAQPLLIAPRT
jgi:DNA-3-methyladenine glycosylase II